MKPLDDAIYRLFRAGRGGWAADNNMNFPLHFHFGKDFGYLLTFRWYESGSRYELHFYPEAHQQGFWNKY